MVIKRNDAGFLCTRDNGEVFHLSFSEVYDIVHENELAQARDEVIDYLKDCDEDTFAMPKSKILSNNELVNDIAEKLLDDCVEPYTWDQIYDAIERMV